VDDWKKYARARNELYHLVVELRMLDAKLPIRNRTKELQIVLDAMVRLVNEALAAFENGEVLALQIDRYHQSELPGLELGEEQVKNPYQVDRD